MQQEKALVRRFNQGNVHALREIYDLYKHDLMTLATALLRDAVGAEDAVHEVFAKLLASRTRLRIFGSLRGYLLTAVANTARDMLSNRAKGNLPTNDLREAWQETPDRPAIRDEQQHKLSEALNKLPYEQREVLLLRYVGGLKFSAIARSQGVSINTVQGRYRYGLEKLRSLMKDKR